jgi:7,8-dihydropterin-6-yl-methyl-4-(beta-D-ribofuranosyl)aminobenzene 5'-phosphate synthase
MDKCTILLENTHSELLSTKTEHGLSILIETDKNKYLFDMGSTGIFEYNARLMNINLKDIKTVILSHSHYDHCSGLLSFLDNHSIDNIYVGQDFFKEKYALNDSTITYLGCGFDKKYLQDKSVKINEINKDVYKLEESLYIVTNFKQHYEHEIIPSRFVNGNLETLTKDNFIDEIALVKETETGLTLIVGCAHRGILSIIKSVNSMFDKNIDTVIGGVHLNAVDEERIISTSKELLNLGIKKTYFLHCSGKQITNQLKKEKNIEANYVATGDIILL